MNQNTISDRSMNDAAAYLRKRRHELKLTQQAVADKAEIKLQQYQKFESGERSILTASFFITCKVLLLSIRYIIPLIPDDVLTRMSLSGAGIAG